MPKKKRETTTKIAGENVNTDGVGDKTTTATPPQ